MSIRFIVRVFLIVVFVVFLGFLTKTSFDSRRDVQAFGNLSVKYQGQKLNGPLFVAKKMMPGECESRELVIKNNGSVSSRVFVKAISLGDQLMGVVNLKIVTGDDVLRNYTLSSFFGESATSSGVLLDRMSPNETKNVAIEACIDESAGNNFANSLVKFDLIFSEVLDRFDLPPECASLQSKITKKITGTERNDRLRGKKENEYIVGLGGKDNIDGGGGDDCIVGGDGDDRIDGRGGNDIILGGRGKDWLGGSDGNDRLYGGDGDDKVDGGWDDDWLSGGEGRDDMNGDRGYDRCIQGEKYKNCEQR